MRVAILFVMLTGCAVECDDGARAATPDLTALPSDGAPPRGRDAVDAAAAELSRLAGLPTAPAVEVHWVSVPLSHSSGDADGLADGCTLWLRWSAGSRLPSYLIAHEVAHCVRRTLTGDGDGAHADRGWWAPDGLVDQARIAMAARGL